ncbi:hypothetical protein EXU30_01265 [Shewanella maritima]|uniref:Uncharacterized protein n=1 Tax=Shewanella maritima TaxID=2520507 RepID=A0A411PD45_9GAMM|nr:hypothetical protein [Shewanella maritima]QBF81475.1 hypothetical protein EXU30_01265 [Shewanella maritima]
MNDASGGSKYRPVEVSVTPQSIQHLIEFVGGGLFQTSACTASLSAKLANGGDILTAEIFHFRKGYRDMLRNKH